MNAYNEPSKTVELRTLTGETVRVEGRIKVYRASGGDLFFSVDAYALFPRGRKYHKLSESPYFGKIVIQPLAAEATWRARADIAPEEYRRFLRELPVVVERFSSRPVELTMEIIEAAHAHVEAICDCPAVRNSGA